MILAFARSGAWIAVLSGVGAVVWATVTSMGTALPGPATRQPYSAPPLVPYPADSLVAVGFRRDLFRPERRPSSVAYDPGRLVVAEAPPAPKPTLALVGIVGGAAGSAVIEGFPGVDGWRVVYRGDVVAGLRVQTIGRDSVVIAGLDTVWVLRVREPWK